MVGAIPVGTKGRMNAVDARQNLEEYYRTHAPQFITPRTPGGKKHHRSRPDDEGQKKKPKSSKVSQVF